MTRDDCIAHYRNLLEEYPFVKQFKLVLVSREQFCNAKDIDINSKQARGIRGGFYPADLKVLLVYDNLKDKQDFYVTCLHELCGHYGLNTFKPKEKELFLNSIIASRNNFKSIWDKVERNYPRETDLMKAEEVYAYLTGFQSDLKKSLLPSDFSETLLIAKKAWINNVIGIKELSLKAIVAISVVMTEELRLELRKQQTFPINNQSQFYRNNNMDKEKQPLHKEVATKLVNDLALGNNPFITQYLPFNPINNKRFKGINVLQLLCEKRQDPRWLTFNQAQKIGAKIKKGEKGKLVQFWIYEEKNDKGQIVKLERPKSFYTTVFNAEQMTGLLELDITKVNQNKIDFVTNAKYITSPVGTDGYYKECLRTSIVNMLTGDKNNNEPLNIAFRDNLIRLLSEDPKELLRACADGEKMYQEVVAMIGVKDSLETSENLDNLTPEEKAIYTLIKNECKKVNVATRVVSVEKEYIKAFLKEYVNFNGSNSIISNNSDAQNEGDLQEISKSYIGVEYKDNTGRVLDITSIIHKDGITCTLVNDKLISKGVNSRHEEFILEGVLTGIDEEKVSYKRPDMESFKKYLDHKCAYTKNSSTSLMGFPINWNGKVTSKPSISISGYTDILIETTNNETVTVNTVKDKEFADEIVKDLPIFKMAYDNYVRVAKNNGFITEINNEISDFDSLKINVTNELKEDLGIQVSLNTKGEGMTKCDGVTTLMSTRDFNKQKIDFIEQVRERLEILHTKRVYINVPYKDRNEAKSLGAKWDSNNKVWYIANLTNSDNINLFEKWLNPQIPQNTVNNEVYLDKRMKEEIRKDLSVPYDDRNEAKSLGAKWDSNNKVWYAIGTKEEIWKLSKYFPENRVVQDPAMSVKDEFIQALKDMGCVVDTEIVMDGTKQRIATEGDKKGEKAGFYVAYTDGLPAGYIKNNRTGQELKWKSKGYVLNEGEKKRLATIAEAKKEERNKEIESQYLKTSTKMEYVLSKQIEITDNATPYLKNKEAKVYQGLFTDQQGGTTYLPAYDINQKLWNIQFINEDGTKRFAKDSKKEGCFHPIGGFTSLDDAKIEIVIISEGYATGNTIKQALEEATLKSIAVVSAFDAGNLLPVAKAIKDKYPNIKIIIAGDSDLAVLEKEGINPGEEKARAAAAAVDGVAIFPIFAPGEQEKDKKKFTDYNDLATKSELGMKGVIRQITRVVAWEQEKQTKQQQQQQNQQEQIQTRSRGLSL